MSKVIFKDAEQQSLFEKQGFIVLPFLSADEVTALNEIFDILHPHIAGDAGFVSGSYSADFDYKEKASNEIVKIFSRHYEQLFVNYQPFGAAFLFKMPNVHSHLSIHQDWTIVDEEKYVALNCWVPLTDVNEKNGALHVVPATHYDKIKTLRAPTLPFFFSGNDDVVEKASLPMYIKAGEAVILNQSVIHYSPPNNSQSIRKAITAGVKSKGAPMVFHYRNNASGDARIERFSMPENFLISFENFMEDILHRPKMGSSDGFVDFDTTPLNREELMKRVRAIKNTTGNNDSKGKSHEGVYKKLAKLFMS
jgi:hypothetical protein